jgi:TatA/E family protein of Tat protein translocase
MGPLGLQETIVIFVLALLIFGPKKLPELGKTIGKAMTEFRRASSELKSTWDREMHALEREQESLKEATLETNKQIQGEISTNYYDDSYGSYDYDSGYDYGTENSRSTATDSSTVGATETQGAEQSAANTEGDATSNQDSPAAVAKADPPAASPNGTVSEPVRS